MNINQSFLAYLFLALSLSVSGGCATKQVDLHDSLSVQSKPTGANIYIKRLDEKFSKFEIESNNSTMLNPSYFAEFDKSDALNSQTNNTADDILVITGKAPGRFTLHRKGEYAVVLEKDGFVRQTAIVKDQLTAGEAAGNVAKTAGTAAGGLLLSVIFPPAGLAVLAGSAAKKGSNMKSGKNKELSPNPLILVLESNDLTNMTAISQPPISE